MSIDYRIIGKRLQDARKLKKLTQERLAEKLEVSVGYVSQIERGITKPNLEMIDTICKHLDCDLSYIVSGVDMSDDTYLQIDIAHNISLLSSREKNIILALTQSLLENR